MTVDSESIIDQVIDHDTLFERIRAGHTLVTGNTRLSRVITNQYNQWRMAQGDRQWPSPAIMPWTAWIGMLWESASLRGCVNDQLAVPISRQLINLWERVLNADSHSSVLLRPDSLASVMNETRSLVRDWQVDLADTLWFGDRNENHVAFHHWNSAFEQLCQQECWIPPEDRPALLVDAIRKLTFTVSGPVNLLGFDELSPGQAGFLQAVTKSGTPVNRLGFSPASGGAVLWQSKDSKGEMRRMARWVRYWSEKEPGSTIAVVVPDLHNRRAEVERHLQEVLVPDRDLMKKGTLPWNISMGAPLAREPLIQTAFDLLKLLDRRLDIQDVGRVLRSPWLRGGISERNSRALLEKCLRDNHPRQLKLSEIRYRSTEINRFDRMHHEIPLEAREPQPWNSPKFSNILSRLTHFQDHSGGRHPPSAWAEKLDQLLVSLGWPLKGQARSTGQHNRNWQALQAWRDSLRELSSLDATTKKMSCAAAISQLQKICREKIFQPLTPPAPIQVLGLYEVSGLSFDHLWVMGLHNNNWPPAATPNPFIPPSLQHKALLPHSSPQRELEVARTVTNRLLETAPDCVFSFPGQLDGEEVLASPLLIRTGINAEGEVPGWQGERWQTRISKATGPQIDPLQMPGRLQGETAKGGSSILKNQALCPFRAFATNRLAAESLESPADGISPKLHGSLVHKVLETFWQETKTQGALLNLDSEGLYGRVRKHVDQVVSEEIFLQQRPNFARVEADRLQRQALANLELDKVRESFTVIEFEKEILPEIEGQTIRLVIDRIDTVESGEEVIIDYKTGKVDPKKWFGARPEDPQLPLYAISTSTTPAAVAFAVIRDDGYAYKGVVRREGVLPELPPKSNRHNEELIDAGFNMPDTIDNWRQVLHHLMASFLAGEATVDPKNGRKTCDNSYCELQSLCRIDELQSFLTTQSGLSLRKIST